MFDVTTTTTTTVYQNTSYLVWSLFNKKKITVLIALRLIYGILFKYF